MECVVSYCGAHGSYAAGTILRADHPAVAANDGFWVRQADPGAKAAALLAINAEIDASAAASARSKDDAYRPQAGVARATRPLTVVVPNPDGAPRSRNVYKNETLPVDDEVVRANP